MQHAPSVRFALLGPVGAAFEELSALGASAGVSLAPLECPSYAALEAAVADGVAAFAWAPPLVAASLECTGDAIGLAIVERSGARSYHAALVARGDGPVLHLGELDRARIGWVSRLSAAGYVVPRAHLVSLGVPLAFAEERLLHTHGAAAAALAQGEVDVIATHARIVGRRLELPHVPHARILCVTGPISGEVVVAGRAADVDDVAALGRALLGARLPREGALAALDVTGFGPIGDGAGRPAHRSESSTTTSYR